MSHPSKASVTDLPKTYNPRTGKGHKEHLPNMKTKTVQQINKDISAHTIQRAWLSHMDKAIFQLLKHTVCAAAMFDACRIMWEKKFYHQIMEDEHLFQKFKITDKIDIVTLQDYMQYSSLLDETPASSGGRNNYWRKLSLKNIPKTMIIYNIVDYAESGVISKRLRKEMKYLLHRDHKQNRCVSTSYRLFLKHPSSFSSGQPLYWPNQQQSQIKHLGRRSKEAQMKVEKMKKSL